MAVEVVEESDPREHIFNGVHFTIVQGSGIPEQVAQKIRQQLEDNGAIYIPLRKDGSIGRPAELSHIISSHIDFPEYDATFDNNCHVVKPSWVENSLIKKRKAQTRQHSPDPALIFRDVVVTFGDVPQGDKDAITAGVIAMGGMYSSALTKMVTHIVSNTENSEKIRTVKNMGLSMRVVLPHWFDDCLKLGKRIGERPYTLPNPEVFDSSDFHARNSNSTPDLTGALSAAPREPPRITPPLSSPGEPATPRKTLSVFKGKKIHFADDLGIHEKLAVTLAELAEYSGASIVDSALECDIFIGHYRDGDAYVSASRANKTVGNLAWFYDVITRNRWSNPIGKLLHYPIPRDGIPGFKGLRISLSNYIGDSRPYLEAIITYAGGEFTKTMRQENTHLITAHKKSEKCDAAQEWNVNIINHLWLEESYAKCQIQSLTNHRYTHFPPKTNLSEIVGQTPIDFDRIAEMYLGGGTDASASQTATPGGNARTDHSNLPPTNRKSADSESATRTPSLQRRHSEKENEAPLSTMRASKAKAAAELEKAAMDMAVFEKEMKRKGGVTHGRERNREQSLGEPDEAADTGNDDHSATARPGKKQKVSDAADFETIPVKYKMLMTGEERWAKKPKRENEDRRILRGLGIEVITNPVECNLLCAPRILRTKKFVIAISSAPEIVNTGFLDYALRHKSLQDTSAYGLQDREMETKYGIHLDESVKRAHDNNHRLLRGWTIYVTDKVAGGFDTFKDIIEANGGTAIPYRGRTGIQLPRRRLTVAQDPDAGLESQNQGGDEETDFVYLVSGATDEEAKLWAAFRKMAEKQGLQERIVKTDWLLNCAMAQRVEWNEEWELNT